MFCNDRRKTAITMMMMLMMMIMVVMVMMINIKGKKKQPVTSVSVLFHHSMFVTPRYGDKVKVAMAYINLETSSRLTTID